MVVRLEIVVIWKSRSGFVCQILEIYDQNGKVGREDGLPLRLSNASLQGLRSRMPNLQWYHVHPVRRQYLLPAVQHQQMYLMLSCDVGLLEVYELIILPVSMEWLLHERCKPTSIMP